MSTARICMRYLLALMFAGTSAAIAAEALPDASTTALRGMFLLRDVPLRQHPSCKSVGSHATDRTVGHYMAGFMSAMREDSNRIEADCIVHASGAAAKRCTVWLKHADAEDEWAWGLQFNVNKRDRPIKSSVFCLGGG